MMNEFELIYEYILLKMYEKKINKSILHKYKNVIQEFEYKNIE